MGCATYLILKEEEEEEEEGQRKRYESSSTSSTPRSERGNAIMAAVLCLSLKTHKSEKKRV